MSEISDTSNGGSSWLASYATEVWLFLSHDLPRIPGAIIGLPKYLRDAQEVSN